MSVERESVRSRPDANASTVERLRTQGRQAALLQDPEAAESAFVAAIEAAENDDPNLLVQLYRDLAGVCRLDGRFAQAQDLTQAADLLEERLTPTVDQSPAALRALVAALRADADRHEDLGYALLLLARTERLEADGRATAAVHLAEAIDIFESLGHDELTILELSSELANYRAMAGDLPAAMETAERIRERLRAELPLHASGMLRTLAQLCAMNGDVDRAVAYAQEAIELAEAAGSLAVHAAALGALGLIRTTQGDLEAAADLFREALIIVEPEPEPSVPTAMNLLRLGNVERRLGRLDDSTAHVTRAVEILRAGAPRSSELGDALEILGDIARASGELGTAVAAYRESATLAAGATQRIERQINLGNVQKALNLLDDAGRTLTAAAAEAEALGNADLASGASISLAGVLRWRGDLDGAERVYAAHLDKLTNQFNRLQVVSNLAGIAYDREQFADAERLYRQALALAEQHDPHAEITPALLYNLATSLHGGGKRAEADDLYAKAIDELPGNSRERVEAWSARADIAVDQERLDDAVYLYQQAIAAAERLRSAAGGDASRAALGAVVKRHYLNLVHILQLRGTAGDAELSLAVVELIRARTLEERLSESGMPNELRLEEQRLRRRLADTSRQRLTALNEADPDAAILAALTGQEQELAAALEALPRPAVTTTVLTAEQIRAAVPDGALLLEYQLVGNRMHLWAVTRQSVDHHVLAPTANTLLDLVLRAIGPYHAETPDQGDPAAWDELRTGLVAPVRDRLAEVTLLMISPDELLQPLSFEPLTDRPVVVYMSSATTGLRPRPPLAARPRDAEFVGLGNPAFDRSLPEFARLAALPGAAIEVEEIAALFGDRAVALSGAQATESELRSWARRCRYLHIATHALVDTENPMRSGIVLATTAELQFAGRPSNDDILHGFEMIDLRIEAELVVCAACRTGFGVESAGTATGLATIGSAMLLGGARWVLVTLWPIGDLVSAAFMRVLYEALTDGAGVPEAVGTAREEIRLDHPDPYWWAGFVLLGGPG